MHAVLVIGNPRFVNTELANNYYSELVQFVESLGVEPIISQAVPGTDYVLPIGDLYISHGRDTNRLANRPVECKDAPTVRLGWPDGVIHPRDLEWQLEGSKGIPPKEHYLLTADQKLAIQQTVEALRKLVPPVELKLTRQSASRRPTVR